MQFDVTSEMGLLSLLLQNDNHYTLDGQYVIKYAMRKDDLRLQAKLLKQTFKTTQSRVSISFHFPDEQPPVFLSPTSTREGRRNMEKMVAQNPATKVCTTEPMNYFLLALFSDNLCNPLNLLS